MRVKKGKAYLLGAGPGDPDLLTIKAASILRTADVVLYDRLVTAEILALANPSAEFLYAGKHEGEQEAVQEWICSQMAERARQGKTVARLKGGDPYVFGRGGEERLFLEQQGIDVEVVPGVSSVIAAPAAAGIPLTLRGVSRSFAVITGHRCAEGELDWEQFTKVDTLVILMGVTNRADIARGLIAAGRPPDEPAAFVERATTPSQQVTRTTLEQIAAGSVEITAPAVLVVGAVAALGASGREQGVSEHGSAGIGNTDYR
jgi:uroporphyrin-III C-methyltransferase